MLGRRFRRAPVRCPSGSLRLRRARWLTERCGACSPLLGRSAWGFRLCRSCSYRRRLESDDTTTGVDPINLTDFCPCLSADGARPRYRPSRRRKRDRTRDPARRWLCAAQRRRKVGHRRASRRRYPPRRHPRHPPLGTPRRARRGNGSRKGATLTTRRSGCVRVRPPRHPRASRNLTLRRTGHQRDRRYSSSGSSSS